REFRARVAADPRLAAEIGDPWGELERVQPEARRLYPAFYLLETRAGGGSQLFNWANQIVRAAQERTKPSAERLPDYGDARLRAMQTRVLAERPTYARLDEVQLAWWLSKLREALAVRLATGTRLGDPAVRRALWEGGLAAVEASQDPLIRFALRAQPVTRAARADYEERVQAPTDRA